MKKLILLTIALTLITACSQKLVWIKDGASQEEFLKDRYACQYQSQMLYSTQSIATDGWGRLGAAIASKNNFNACMKSKGYYLVKDK